MKIVRWTFTQRSLVFGTLACVALAISQLSSANEHDIEAFADGYAAAWSNQDPAALASFYAEDGVLIVNHGEPSVGRAAIEAKARGFMEAFPDMRVTLEKLEPCGEALCFHWRWTGTNTGPGGTGNSVDLTGYEAWILDEEGLIERSLGHYDQAEYQRQVQAGMPDS